MMKHARQNPLRPNEKMTLNQWVAEMGRTVDVHQINAIDMAHTLCEIAVELQAAWVFCKPSLAVAGAFQAFGMSATTAAMGQSQGRKKVEEFAAALVVKALVMASAARVDLERVVADCFVSIRQRRANA